MGLAEHNLLSDADAARALASVCAAPRWVDEMLAARPYADVDELFAIADHVLAQLSADDLDAALAGHPRIGSTASSAGHDGAQSRREQAGVDANDTGLQVSLADANRAYEERFGRIYLVCASGRTGPELLALLLERLANDADDELSITLAELGKINRLRIAQLAGA